MKLKKNKTLGNHFLIADSDWPPLSRGRDQRETQCWKKWSVKGEDGFIGMRERPGGRAKKKILCEYRMAPHTSSFSGNYSVSQTRKKTPTYFSSHHHTTSIFFWWCLFLHTFFKSLLSHPKKQFDKIVSCKAINFVCMHYFRLQKWPEYDTLEINRGFLVKPLTNQYMIK